MTKVNRLTILFLFIFAFVVSMFFVVPNDVTASAEINFIDVVEIRNGENGYLYGNGSEFKEADSLQEIFDDVVDRGLVTNARIRFNNVYATDKIVLDYERKVVIESGIVTYDGEVEDNFITIKSGALEVFGAEINSDSACVIRVENGAEFTLSSGTLSIDGAVSGKIQSTLLNAGTSIITGGKISYASSVAGNAGQAISQIGASSRLTITESVADGVLCMGKSALRITDGIVEINSGTFKATANDSVQNGASLIMTGNSKVTINGGKFESVNVEKTITLAGNGNSMLTLNGGSIKGRITFNVGSGGNTTSLAILGREVISSDYGNVIVYSDEENLTTANAKLGLVGQKGYYLSGWVGVTSLNPLVSEFSQNATILALASNLYEVTLKVGDETYKKSVAYGSVCNPEDFGVVVKEGYAIKRWKNSLGDSVGLSIVAKGEETFTAELVLATPSLNEITDVRVVYDGSEFVRSVSSSELEGLTYQYVWKKKNAVNEWLDVYSGKDISFNDVKDSGEYKVEVSVSDGIASVKSESNSFVVEIAKGEYEGVTHPTITGVYSPSQRLSSFELEAGFNWVNLSEVPTVSKKNYEANYCLDESNYNVKTLMITIELEKAPAVEEEHTLRASGYKYSGEKTLADYPFSDSAWRWADESIVPRVGNNSYLAYHNPDRENYLDYATKVSLVIGKGEYENVPNLYLELVYEAGLDVAEVVQKYSTELGAYSFAKSVSVKEPLCEIKTFVFDATYNLEPNNYNDYVCKIEIKVTKGNVSADYNAENVIDGGAYAEGKTLADVYLISSSWRWKNPEMELASGDNACVIIYNPNVELYNDYELEVIVKVEKGAVDNATHRKLSGTYSPTQTLGDFTLDYGWSWIDASIVPTVAKTKYSAVFNKGSDYVLHYAEVELVLEKADLDVSGIVFEAKTVTYDGQAHNIEYQGTLPSGLTFSHYEHTSPIKNAGIYECKAYFTQADTENYNVAKTVFTAKLVINRASVDMSGIVFNGKEVTYDGSEHFLSYEGTLPSNVRAIYFNNGKVLAGRYVVELLFELDDVNNYNQVQPMQAVLVIKKASSTIAVGEKYEYAYDAKEHVPTAMIGNAEQTIAYTIEGDAKNVGEHIVKFYANESVNYLYVEKEVKVIINVTSVECGNVYGKEISALIGKVTNAEVGVADGVYLTMPVITLSNEEIVFDVLLGGNALQGNYTVSILMPDGLTGQPKVYLWNGTEYVEISSVVGGNYVIFSTSSLGRYKLVATEKWQIVEDDRLDWWAWLLIAVAIVMAIGGSVTGIIIAGKKGKISLDRIRAIFKNVQKKSVDENQDASNGENDEK